MRRFSQQALRSLELDGRSYLLPTLTLSRTGAKATGRSGRVTPVVLDLQLVSSDGSPHSQSIKKHELRNEVLQLQDAGYVAVGVTNASEDVKQAAAKLNLPYFIGTRLPAEQKLAVQEHVVEKQEKTQAATLPPMVVTHSVRSGQQIFAQNRSLVVLGNVSSGAEVMADEDVTVLGALKGRALAGIGGNVRARIVCQSFDAELISIAHCFTTCDELEQDENDSLRLHKPTVVSLQDDRLHFESST